MAVVKKYIGLMPEGNTCKKFHLRPRKLPLPNVWFCDAPYGINKVKSTVREICKQAGFVGKFTNHSLRATCATRMFHSNVPEQLIKETTGHRSECVRVYKRTSEELKQAASDTINNANPVVKRVKLDPEPDVRVFDPKPSCSDLKKVCSDTGVDTSDDKKSTLSLTKMMENVLKTRMELRKNFFPKSRLSLKKYKGHKVTIDLNVNVKK